MPPHHRRTARVPQRPFRATSQVAPSSRSRFQAAAARLRAAFARARSMSAPSRRRAATSGFGSLSAPASRRVAVASCIWAARSWVAMASCSRATARRNASETRGPRARSPSPASPTRGECPPEMRPAASISCQRRTKPTTITAVTRSVVVSRARRLSAVAPGLVLRTLFARSGSARGSGPPYEGGRPRHPRFGVAGPHRGTPPGWPPRLHWVRGRAIGLTAGSPGQRIARTGSGRVGVRR
jgi:hypothetical protein